MLYFHLYFVLFVVLVFFFFFFFQAEDGIRDLYVTGVQTCALPISRPTTCWATAFTVPSPPAATTTRSVAMAASTAEPRSTPGSIRTTSASGREIGRASCRERVEISGGAVS